MRDPALTQLIALVAFSSRVGIPLTLLTLLLGWLLLGARS